MRLELIPRTQARSQLESNYKIYDYELEPRIKENEYLIRQSQSAFKYVILCKDSKM